MQRKTPKTGSEKRARGQTAKDWLLPGQPHIHGTAFWVWDLETDFVFMSPEWENILQSREYDFAEPGKHAWWRKRVHQDDLPAMLEQSDNIIAGKSERYEALFRLQRADGCWAWLFSRGAVTERKNGRAAKVSGVVSDISVLRNDPKFQMAEAVGSAAYHAMLENSPDMFVRMDRELFSVYVNPAVARHMERERDKYYSYRDSLDELNIRPEQVAYFQERVARVFDEKATWREEVTFRNADGRELTGEYSFWPEFDAKGNVVFAMTQFRDLSEHIKAERQTRLNEKRLEALNCLTLMDNAPEAEVLNFVLSQVLELTQSGSGFIFIPWGDSPYEGDMIWSEDHFEHLDRAYLPQHSFPSDLIALVTEADGSINFSSLRNGDGVHPVHVSFDGKMPIIRSMIAPAMDGNRVACIAGVCNKAQDYDEIDLRQLKTFINGAWLVIQRQRFLRELHRAKEAAERANKVKDVFLANVSHELRTPLNGMLSMLQLLELQPMTGQQHEYVNAANDSGRALLRIISDILDFSRVASGRMCLQKEPFSLRETVGSTMRLFNSEAIKKGLRFYLSLGEDIPDSLLGDEARFRQIIYNVVGNALKFTEKGEIAVTCDLLPREEDGRVRIRISVRDTGIGIPQEKQDVIFEAFTQIDSSSTRRYGGTGLGLSIVKQLVGLMDGSIAIDSEVGRGTTMHCIVALDEYIPREEAGEAEKTAVCPPEQMPELSILVAEDDEVGRFAIRSFLQRIGYKPLIVADGRQALEALQLHRFDCLFTDIQMPGMDGLEVTRRIRTGNLDGISPSDAVRAMVEEFAPGEGKDILPVAPDMIVVAVSAHAMSGDRERFLALGTDFYLSKPVRISELSAVLAGAGELLRRRREKVLP